SSGSNDKLTGQYAAAIQQAVLAQWIRPDSVPRGQRCRLTIRQLPGGEVVDVEVSPACPYDEAGRRSVEAAVLRAQPLPYRGFESVFQRTVDFNFEAQDR
ncbi:MAG: TonB C-terminal domain-containing protein, partial [Pseudoxanthomonas sp.]|nr:TonB C-terminal domain-containing protein [Pseudoxanthomonas sp.]